MKLVLVVLLAASALAFAQQKNSPEPSEGVNMSYSDFKQKFKNSDGLLKSLGRSDAAAEKVYNENCANIKQHNSERNETYKQGISSNADMTAEDILKTRKGFKLSNETSSRQRRQTTQNEFNVSSGTKLESPMANVMDLRSVMSPVKDQQSCDSAWAFAATAIMEYWSKKNGTSQIFSEQVIIDCDSGSSGCSGGDPYTAFVYALTSGITDSSKYEYTSRDGTCRKKESTYYLENACRIDLNGNENTLKVLLNKIGPMAVAISTKGSGNGFNHYSSGVFYYPQCSTALSDADLVVVVVGYGAGQNAGDFWIVRNAWGTSWGENGYMRIARNRGNHCGIANYAAATCPLNK